MSQISDQNILLKAQLSAAGANQSVTTNNNHVDTSDNRFQVDQLQIQIQNLISENSHQKTKITFYESENSRLVAELEQSKLAQNELTMLRSENVDLTSKIAAMTKDQDDLLELLADQDLKLKDHRKKLKNLGQQVDGSDDEN